MVFPVLVGADAPVGALRVQAGVPAEDATAALINIHTVSRSVFLEAVLTRLAGGGEVDGRTVQQPPRGRTARTMEGQPDARPALQLDPAFVVGVQNDGAVTDTDGMLTLIWSWSFGRKFRSGWFWFLCCRCRFRCRWFW